VLQAAIPDEIVATTARRATTWARKDATRDGMMILANATETSCE
jgi:hypothetical protein